MLEHDARNGAIAAVIQMVVLRTAVGADKIEKKELPSLLANTQNA